MCSKSHGRAAVNDEDKYNEINHGSLLKLAHKDFVQLLADIEIYVDRVASMQVQSLNAYLDVAQQAMLYCKRLGINYSKLTETEFQQQIHILDESALWLSEVL